MADARALIDRGWLSFSDLDARQANDVLAYDAEAVRFRHRYRHEAERMARMRGMTEDETKAYVAQAMAELG